MIDHGDVVDKMNAKYGSSTSPTDQAGNLSGPGQRQQEHGGVEHPGHQRQDDRRNAYEIVKLIFDKKADLVAVHEEAKNIDYKYQMKDNSPVPWHPGALKYFADKGVKM